MSQKTAILRHLKERGSITALEALDLCGSMRLAGRIYELRQEGWDIKERTEKHDGGTHSRYLLEQSEMFV